MILLFCIGLVWFAGLGIQGLKVWLLNLRSGRSYTFSRTPEAQKFLEDSRWYQVLSHLHLEFRKGLGFRVNVSAFLLHLKIFGLGCIRRGTSPSLFNDEQTDRLWLPGPEGKTVAHKATPK